MPKSKGVKTRQGSGCKIADYVGSGRDLINSELPTLRDILRLGIKFQEDKFCGEDKGRHLYPLKDLVKDLSAAVQAAWIRANAEFVPPVVILPAAIERRIEREWVMARDIANKNVTKAKQIKTFEDKLDKLLDITKCKCHIFTCQERECVGPVECAPRDHITCSCSRDLKLPVLDLQFLRMQREKIGERSDMIISGVGDMKEHERQVKYLENKARKEAVAQKAAQKVSQENFELSLRVEAFENQEFEAGNTLDNENNVTQDNTVNVLKMRNTMDISGLAIQAIRCEASNRTVAALSTAYLGDLIRSGILPKESAYLAVDPAKVQRAKDKVLTKAKEKGEIKSQEEDIMCIMFDARIDPTKVRYYDEETGKFFPRIESEDHYTITDGDGRYLHHFTKPGGALKSVFEDKNGNIENEDTEEVTEHQQKRKKKKPAEIVADYIVDWMKNYGVDESLKIIAGDSTNPNTGWKGGAMTWVERKIGRKLHWLVCQLHTNELMLRHLMTDLDGKTDSKDGFSGPIGKLLKKVERMRPNFEFEKIEVGPGLIELPESVISDLSTDQNLLYQRCRATITGVLPRDVALRKAGKIVHSRWLTMALTLIEMWQSEHGLEGELLDRLRVLVTFIVSVYCPMWFQIKVKHSWLEGPRHILMELSLYRLQSPQVQAILLPTLTRSAWNSHSESVLQTMICSKDKAEREFAVKTILKIRDKNNFGDLRPRARKLPDLNVMAEKLEDLINWEDAKEPVLTCSLSKEEIKMYLDSPMEVPYFSLHTQGIERAIKEVTAASSTVFGFERRDGFVRARAESRELMPVISSKKNLAAILLE